MKAKPKKKENAFSALLKEVNKNKLCESMDMSQVKYDYTFSLKIF